MDCNIWATPYLGLGRSPINTNCSSLLPTLLTLSLGEFVAKVPIFNMPHLDSAGHQSEGAPF